MQTPSRGSGFYGYGNLGGSLGVPSDRYSTLRQTTAPHSEAGHREREYTPSHIWGNAAQSQHQSSAGRSYIGGNGVGMISPHGAPVSSGAFGAGGNSSRFLSPRGSFISTGVVAEPSNQPRILDGDFLDVTHRTSQKTVPKEEEGSTGPPSQSIYEESAWTGALPRGPNNSGDRVEHGPGNKHDRWVTVFGFAPSSASYVLRHMQRFGDVVAHKRSGSNNWMHIQYQTPLQAQMALSVNGTVLGGSLMIGVRSLATTIDSESFDATTTPAQPLNPSSLRSHEVDFRGLLRDGHPHAERSLIGKIGEYLFGW